MLNTANRTPFNPSKPAKCLMWFAFTHSHTSKWMSCHARCRHAMRLEAQKKTNYVFCTNYLLTIISIIS